MDLLRIGTLVTEGSILFIIAMFLHFRYALWSQQHAIVTVSVLVAWYLSFLIIFVLPLDVSSTVYRQCMQTLNASSEQPTESAKYGSSDRSCQVPWSYVPDVDILPYFWRIVYWSSQCLTWLILPVMQSYTKAGDFTGKDKLRSALKDIAFSYIYKIFICCVLLVYIVLKPDLDGVWNNLTSIPSSVSNTYGLILLTLLLGHALVKVPRSFWRHSSPQYSLDKAYFQTAKLNKDERAKADNDVDIFILKGLPPVMLSVAPGHYLHSKLEKILQNIPADVQGRIEQRPPADGSVPEEPTEKSLVALHKKVKRVLHVKHKVEAQWVNLMDEAIALEDKLEAGDCIGYYLKCKEYLTKSAAICAGTLSAAIIWSHVTSFVKEPVLSIFAWIIRVASPNYVAIELISIVVIAYLCFCTYMTVFKIRIFNLYHLVENHGTDECSLIWSGKTLCKLTTPICLLFLSLIRMDNQKQKETHFTEIMGHIDVIDTIQSYLPAVLVLMSAASYLSLVSRVLSWLEFDQFIGGEGNMSDNLIDKGKDLVKEERQRRATMRSRNEENSRLTGASFTRKIVDVRSRNQRQSTSREELMS